MKTIVTSQRQGLIMLCTKLHSTSVLHVYKPLLHSLLLLSKCSRKLSNKKFISISLYLLWMHSYIIQFNLMCATCLTPLPSIVVQYSTMYESTGLWLFVAHTLRNEKYASIGWEVNSSRWQVRFYASTDVTRMSVLRMCLRHHNDKWKAFGKHANLQRCRHFSSI